MFFTLNVLGANNNDDVENPVALMDPYNRMQANIAWLCESFRIAQSERSPAVVLALHADMFKPEVRNFYRPLLDAMRIVSDALRPAGAVASRRLAPGLRSIVRY